MQMQDDAVEDVQSRECRFLVGDLERISGLVSSVQLVLWYVIQI